MAHETAPARQPRSPLGIGLFWFMALVAATAVGTGAVNPQEFIAGNDNASADGSSATHSSAPHNDPGRGPFVEGRGHFSSSASSQSTDDERRGWLDAWNNVADRGDADFESTPREPASESVAPAAAEQTSPGPRLALHVESPESVNVDGFLTVNVTLHNASGAPAENIAVTCEFDEHFEYLGSSDHVVRQPLRRIDAGESRRLLVPLTACRPGRGCLQLHVSSNTHADSTVERCVNITAQGSVAVSIDGPRRRTVGSRAEYVVTCVNESESDLPDSIVAVTYDSSLTLKEVSTGAHHEPGLLRWDLGTLYVEERIQIQMEFECRSEVDSAPLTAVVSSERGRMGRAQSGLTVSARPALELRVSDMADPLTSGRRSSFLLEVENHTAEPVRGIVLYLVPSRNIEITVARVRLGGRELKLDAFVEENSLRFEAAPPLRPGGQLVYNVEFAGHSAGRGELRALLQSRGLPAPLEVCEPIVINPPAAED